MSTITRTIRNFIRVGPRNAAHQMQYIGDTKAGTFIGTDRYGNKFFENLEEELPLRTRWVDYKDKEFDPDHIEPGWHAWMSYMAHDPPNKDPILSRPIRPWEPAEHKANKTASRAAYKPYSTTKAKYDAWIPQAVARQ